MDTTLVLAVIMGLFAIFELAQVFLLRQAVLAIYDRMDSLIPEGKRAGQVLAETAIDFMKMIQENKNGEAQIVGGFIRGAAVAGFEEIKGKIPLLNAGGTEQIDKNLERLSRQNPWAGLLFGFAQAAAPYIADSVSKAQIGGVERANRPNKGTGGW